MIQILKKRWVYHSLLWIVGYLVFCPLGISDENNHTLKDNLFSFWPEVFQIFLIVNFSFLAKSYFFDKRKYLLYLLSLILLISISLIGMIIETSNNNTVLEDLVNIIFLILISLGLQYFKRGIINQYKLQELKAKTAEAELHALKAQINPHFLFNTLNNIYGMNQINSEKASEMILALSDVMRYHLKSSKKEMVRLEEEIALLNSYIQLEKLRLNKNCNLKIDFATVDNSLIISPLLFLPFVENAFKHGTHSTRPSFIYLQIKTIERKVHFDLKNSIINDRKTIKTNIGLDNTKRRLALIYGDKHELHNSIEDSTYLVNLTINL